VDDASARHIVNGMPAEAFGLARSDTVFLYAGGSALILDAAKAVGRRRLQADVVVIGAGPAGLAVASRLAAAGRSVLVLESGGLDPAPDPDAARAASRGPLPYFDLIECRPRGLGGSTGLWGGWCEPLGELDFEARPGLPGSGWCLARSDLEPYYQQARSFCAIPDSRPFRAWRREHEPCVSRSHFEVRSFPVVGLSPLGRRYVGLFDGDGADLLLHATATRIAVSADGAVVDHLVVATPGGNLVATGNAFVLATGGVEIPRLLLASTSPGWPDGLGNGHDLVGRFFMEHPHVDAMRLSGDPALLDVQFFLERETGWAALDGTPLGAAGALVLSEAACRTERVGRIQLFIEPAGGHTEHPIPRRWRDRPLRLRSRAPRAGELAVIAVTEQAPNRDSRVVLGEAIDRHGMPLPVLHWTLTDADLRTLHFGVEAVREVLQGLGAIRVRRRAGRSWPMDTLGGAHHLGTARMADTPDAGVVDRQCRVHGTHNLFIAGGAVFPTSGYAPPTLTIVALALRLGDHLVASDHARSSGCRTS
jgi:choline dehydrogenase-like flavoprotein